VVHIETRNRSFNRAFVRGISVFSGVIRAAVIALLLAASWLPWAILESGRKVPEWSLAPTKAAVACAGLIWLGGAVSLLRRCYRNMARR
jgi:hypothetical protein